VNGLKAMLIDQSHSEEEHVDNPDVNEDADHMHSHPLIEEIFCDVTIQKCLAKYHPAFSTQIISIFVPKPIVAVLDDAVIDKMCTIINEIVFNIR
jgi:hypothetical protein